MEKVLIGISVAGFLVAGLILVFGRMAKKRKVRERAAMGLPPEVIEVPPMPKDVGKIIIAWVVIIAFAIFLLYALYIRS